MQTSPKSARPQTDFKIVAQFVKHISDYCLTRLDAIGDEQIPVHHTLNATEDPV